MNGDSDGELLLLSLLLFEESGVSFRRRISN